MIIVFGALVLYSIFPEYRMAALLLWPFIYSWAWLEWFCKSRFKIPLTLDLFRFVPHAKNFSSSIRYLKLPKTIALSLPLFALSYLLIKPLLPLWLPLFIVAALPKFEFHQKASSPEYPWTFPNEHSIPLSPHYPLLRKTTHFKGEKQFEYAPAQKPHVIFIFLESFRAKNVGCLGGTPAASPNFDTLAEQGVLFSRFYANGLQTFRAMISSFFGIPAHLNTMNLYNFCRIPMIGLPEILKQNGYQTALIQGGHTGFDWTFPFLRKHSFDTILGMESFVCDQKTSWGVVDETLFNFSADWLQKQEQPTFLSLFTITNHHPWESPKPFPSHADLPEPYHRYLQTFAYTDHCLGNFIAQLKQTGLFEKSLIFIMGDHGQEMGEKEAEFAVHHTLYEENIHVPLLILGAQKKRIDQPASQVDLLPTVLDLLKIPATHHSVGRSLLRKEERPVFFSMPRKETKIGSIRGNEKLILGDGEEFYHLPDEKTTWPAPPELKELTRSYFQSIDKIYARSAWTSLEKIPFEIKAPTNSNDAEWATFLESTPPSPILNLSNTKLTDWAVEAIGKKANYLHELNLSNSPLITDRSLEWVADHCPDLTIFSAAQCLLLTNKGPSAIVNRCPRLRYLNLEGVDDLTDLGIQKKTFLDALHLKDCRNLTGDALVNAVKYCPDLHYLVANLEKSTDEHLLQIATHLHQLVYLWLEDGQSITERGLNALLKNNPRLTILVFENLPQLEKIDFSPLKWIHTLKIGDCPQLTDISSLANIEIQNLSLCACPKISSEQLTAISSRCAIVEKASRSFLSI